MLRILNWTSLTAHSETPYATEGQTLLSQLRKKATAEEIQVTIDTIHEKALEQGVTEVLVPSTDAFVTAICRLGAKSLSHDAVSFLSYSLMPSSLPSLSSTLTAWARSASLALSQASTFPKIHP